QVPLPWLRPLMPSKGDFIAVVGNPSSGSSLLLAKRGMEAARSIPVVSARAPTWMPGVDWSDHLWFWKLGLPAVFVTDTAFLRNPNYHRMTDTPDTLDFERMGGAVRGLPGVLVFADREDCDSSGFLVS